MDLSHYRPVCDALCVRDLGNGRGRGQCPRHMEHADLWVSIGDQGRLLVRCYPRQSGTAACRTDELLGAVGLDLRYLYPDWREKVEPVRRNGHHKPRAAVREKPNEPFVIEDEYPYWDRGPTPKGHQWFLSFVVVKKRFQSGKKDFPQKRPNPDFDPQKPASKENPEWLWSTAGKVRNVLFGWRELCKALADKGDRWVFVLEGEKDVKTARKLGLAATCNPGGTGKWKNLCPEARETLKGCNVVVGLDDDPIDPNVGYSPGVRHAQDICRDLLGYAHTIRLLRFPDPQRPGWDFTDWRESLPGDSKTEDVKNRIAALLQKAPDITSEAQIAAIEPLPWKAPEPAVAAEPPPGGPPPAPGSTPAAEPAPPTAVQTAPAAATAAVAPASGVPFLDELRAALSALEAASKAPRSLQEWIGDVWLGAGQLTAAIQGSPDPAAARAAVLQVAARLARGLKVLPELGGGK